MNPNFHSFEDFVDRMAAAADPSSRPLAFLVGSPLTAPSRQGDPGVPLTDGVVELIRESLNEADTLAAFDREVPQGSAARYQSAFQFLIGRRGQDAANRVIRKAVLCARLRSAVSLDPSAMTSTQCEQLGRSLEGWSVPNAALQLAKLLQSTPNSFGHAVLTTNFDPLLEVALAQVEHPSYRTVLHLDGNLGQTVGSGVHIVHLHGYWSGYDTLHTQQQLTQVRPQLKSSLVRLVDSSTIAVLGYGGWDDVLTRTLIDVLSDSTGTPEILWTFYGQEASQIEASSAHIISMLRPAISRGRAVLYKGIDLNEAFEAITVKLAKRKSPPVNKQTSSVVTILFKEKDRGGPSTTSDSVPQSDAWVGRCTELDVLRSSSEPVAFITGLGGQGKSLLAAEYVRSLSKVNADAWWDWRDCREQSDRLVTQIIRALEHLTDGLQNASNIDTTDIRFVVSLLLKAADKHPVTFVFDNVDQYIDLETLRPVRGLDTLITEAHARSHKARFIFTCRPAVTLNDDRALHVPLVGLTDIEVRELLKLRKLPAVSVELYSDVHRVTNGHPLWINMLAMQSLRHSQGLEGVLRLVNSDPSLPNTARSIWDTLTEHQKEVLRTMAEIDQPELESKLLSILPGENANRIGKSLKTLKSFYLIETKYGQNGDPSLDLHPIVRQFIRREFPKKEREPFVGRVIGFFDRMIDRFRGLLPTTPSIQILENWTRKADLLVSVGRHEDALTTLREIGSALLRKGYREEYVRASNNLFREINWAEACATYKEFDAVFDRSITTMIELGKRVDVEIWLGKYADAIPGKSAQYICLCDLWCYAEWFNKDFSSAIRWGEEGDRLKRNSAVDTQFSCEHNLALARRDFGDVDVSLATFLGTESIATLLATREANEEKHSSFYGNIGRCLFLKGDFEIALACYKRSAQLIERESSEALTTNAGYARLWIGELAEKSGDLKLAAIAYRTAECVWEQVAPPLAIEPARGLERILAGNIAHQHVKEMSARAVEAEFVRWLHA